VRKLSNEEKAFISELVRISENSFDVFLANIIDRELNNVDVFLDYDKNSVEYRIDQNIYNNDPTEFIHFARNFSWKIICYIQLLKDLEEKGMLFLYQESPNINNSRFGRLTIGNSYITNTINDPNAVDSIIKYSKKTIIINESLINYAGNNFRTNEEIQYSEEKIASAKNLNTAKNTLIVTTIALLLTMSTSLIQIFGSSENNENLSEKKIIKVLEDIHYDIHKDK